MLRPPSSSPAPRVLMIDVGGSHVKLMVSTGLEMRKFPSVRDMTAAEMVGRSLAIIDDWQYDAVTIGFPGLVKDGRLAREPLNLGGGWMDYAFESAFQRPVRIINDAAMQALANYRGGRMLFMGFGTSIGCALVADGVIVPVELGLVPLGKGMFMTRVTKEARRRFGQERWQKSVVKAVALLRDVFWPEDPVVGGGNAKCLDPFPEGCRQTSNLEGIRGAVRVWEGADLFARPHGTTWRIEPGEQAGVARRRSAKARRS